MTRSAPTYSSGTIPGASSGNIVALITQLETELTAYQSNGETAWETADVIGTGASFEKVYHSVGDRSLGTGSNKGDTDIWMRMYLSGGNDLFVHAYQDWSPTSHTGYREAGSGAWALNVDDATAIDWWCVVNEYECVFIYVQGGAWSAVWFGAPVRPYSSALNGVARITSQSGTGNGVVLGVDRDITASIAVGQTVWLVNQTPDATGLQSVGVDLVTVTAKAAGSITADGVVNTYAVGSLLGLDPCANCAKVSMASGTAGYFVSLMDGTYSTATGQPATVTAAYSGTTEADFDPGIDGLYVGFQPFFSMTISPKGVRGKMQHIRAFTLGTQLDGDIMQVDYDSGQQWKTFVSGAEANVFNGWCTGIGPGAS